MSKERLEELAYNVGISLDGEKALMSSDDYDFLYNYALEQAERVQELEKENKRIKEAYKDREEDLESMREMLGIDWEDMAIELPIERIQGDKINLLEQQNKRYREALEEIVHQENLKETNVFGYDHEDISSYVEEVARKALEGEAGD